MPASKAEQVLDALRALLETVPGATIDRNSVLPEKIPDGGLVILRDGDPGEPEQALGASGARITSMQSSSRCMSRRAMRPRLTLRSTTSWGRSGGARGRPDPRRPRLRPDLRPARTGHRGGRRCAGDQERDALGDRRLRGRRPSRLTLPRLGIQRSGPGKQHEDQRKQAQPGTDRVQASPAHQQGSSKLAGAVEAWILKPLVRRPHHEQRERHD
jgi:hypothetical protein